MKFDPADLKARIADSTYQNIGNLPSNFFPYDYKELYIRPFTVKELRLVSKAAMLKDISHLLRAVDLVTTQDAGNLSVGDFYYVLMWLRIHSMPKTPYVVEWHCDEGIITNKTTGQQILNDETFAVPEDEENWDVVACDAHNSEVIHMTNVEIITLDEENFDDTTIPKGGPIEFDFPRARNIQDMQEALKNPELKLIVGAAQWVKAGDTLEDKIKILESQTDLQAFDDAAVLNETIVHGIKETTTLTCRNCVKKTPHALILDALSFFR